MTDDEFKILFSKSIANRTLYLKDPLLEPWFKKKPYPPVIGFGLPRNNQVVPMVTLALNPSAKEFKNKHLPMSDAHEVQWRSQTSYFEDNPYREWFDKAESILRAASLGQCSYSGIMGDGRKCKCTHLDLSPLPTAGNFDKTYDGFKAGRGQEERARARQLLEKDSKHILVATLRNLHKNSNTDFDLGILSAEKRITHHERILERGHAQNYCGYH